MPNRRGVHPIERRARVLRRHGPEGSRQPADGRAAPGSLPHPGRQRAHHQAGDRGGQRPRLRGRMAFVADHAVFGITEAKVGRGMPWAAPLTRMLPQRVVMELLLTAQPLTAQRAYELGYVNAVVPVAQLRETALRMATTIAANAPSRSRPHGNWSISRPRWAARRPCVRPTTCSSRST